MPPKASNYTLLSPSQTTPFRTPDGRTVDIPIYINTCTGKEHVQCSACNSYFYLNASRTPTYLASHAGSAACSKAVNALRAKELSISIVKEADAVHDSIFNRENPAGPSLPSGMPLDYFNHISITDKTL
jgi:hypothetical protein